MKPTKTPTPQSLDELTLQILMVPMKDFKERVPLMIQDYLAQGFGAFQLMTENEVAQAALQTCFNHLCRRSVK